MIEANTHVDFRYVLSELILIISIISLYIYDKKHKTYHLINLSLLSLWIFAIVFVLYVYGVLGIQNASSTAPFGIILAALLASTSMMKSIAETKANEAMKYQKDEEKAAKEKERKRIFALNVIKTIQVTLGIFSNKANKQYMHKIGFRDSESEIDFDSDIQTTGKLLNSVFCESILPYLNEEEQNIISNFYIEYYRFLAAYNKEENVSLSTQAGLANLAKRPTKKLPEYLKMFSDYAQSYIDLNTKSKEP